MDKITQLAKLLEITGIEPETAALINVKIREALNAPEPRADPKAISALQDLIAEWTGGAEIGEGTGK